MLKLEKRITLHTFDVEYIDQREPKPRAVHHELCVLDGGRVSALERLGQSPASWICQQYARQGFTVGAVHKGERLTANVDTATLWGMAVQQAGTQHKSAAPDPVDRNCAPAGKFVNPLPNLPPVPDLQKPLPSRKPTRPACMRSRQSWPQECTAGKERKGMTRQDYITAILKLLEKADFRKLRLVWVYAKHLIEKEGASA